MKVVSFFTVIAFLICGTHALAQASLNAITEDGKKILLWPDGTWKYAPSAETAKQATSLEFKKAAAATEVLSLNKGAASESYDPNVWTIAKQENPKVTFHHKSGDIYGMVIAERLEMSSEGLKELALGNARKIATSLTVVKDEKRVVNGTEVTYMQFELTMQGITFIFEGNYYAGPSGTIQVVTWTSKNLFPEYKEEMEHFMNGLQVSPVKGQ